jgi:GntR family transcriptional regulator
MIKNYTPKYIQIQESLTNWIECGDIQAGDMIPSERELSEKFNVSRMTVRQAISTLVSYGTLRRVQGLGTFVAEPKNEYDIGLLVSFTESALRGGLKPSGKLLEFEQIFADEKLARTLQINLGQKVHRLVRVRYGNNEPMVLERCYFPFARCPGIEGFDLENQSIYHIWREEYGIVFGKMRQTLEPVMANEFEAQALEVPVNFPLMLVERVSYDVNGLPVEYARDVHRGDKSRFVAELSINMDSLPGYSAIGVEAKRPLQE